MNDFHRKVALASLLSLVACTSGGVAVQGQGILIPSPNTTVTYFADCKATSASTDSSGIFHLQGEKSDGSIDTKHYVTPGSVYVQVLPPAPSRARYYSFDHEFDTTCRNSWGKDEPCSKDLFMLTGSYDELSTNAPGPDVHVRFPLVGSQEILDQHWTTMVTICNIE